MRILHVGKYYPPHRGGMETALRHLAEGLAGAGQRVRVLVAGDGPATRRDDLPGEPGGLIRAGVAVTWNSQPVTLALTRLLRRELAAFAPDVVHLHTPNPLACWAWLRAGGRPGSAADAWPSGITRTSSASGSADAWCGRSCGVAWRRLTASAYRALSCARARRSWRPGASASR